MAELTVLGLRVVLEVARSGSFSAAAATLGYTQSAISRQVAATEDAVGARLFERRARGVRPTAAGEVLVRRAIRVLGEVDGALQEVVGLRERMAGRLVVGAFPAAAASLVPRAVARLIARHPQLDVSLVEAASPVLVRRLRTGRIEVAVAALGADDPDVDLTGLRSEGIRLARGPGIAVASGHRLATKDVVDVEDLAGETWVVGAGPEGEPQFRAWPTLANPRIGYSARQWPTRFGLVAAGLGIAVVPGLAADTVPADVVWLPVRGPAASATREVRALSRESPSHAARAFLHALREQADSRPAARLPASGLGKAAMP